MMFILQAACGCNIGKIRANNEDNFFFDGTILEMDNHGLEKVLSIERSLSDLLYCGVFDGMGGEAFGEEASFIAAKTLLSYTKDSRDEVDLNKVIQTANKQVCHASVNHNIAIMGSTAIILKLSRNQATIVNLGDSKAFLLRNGEFKQISVDDTDQAILKLYGDPKRKPRLTQHLGIEPSEMILEPHFVTVDIQVQDQFLLCSDGLTDMVSVERIEDILRDNASPVCSVDALIKEAIKCGGKDNITVIVCKIVA